MYKWILSVCMGTFLLHSAGLLHGKYCMAREQKTH
ncbi:hypothetical protein [Candidatus Coxiella mudrowiae]